MMEQRRFQFHLLRVFAACAIFVQVNSLVAAAPIVSNETQAVKYLQKYGYMNESQSENPISPETVQTGLRQFQKFFGLRETGNLDSTTLKLMNMPRCGVKDIIGNGGSVPGKRYVIQGTKWRNTNLTYRISKYPSRLKNKQNVDRDIAKAFKVWSDATNLNFMRLDKGHVSIDIRFEEGEHCDPEPFDGPGGIYGHASSPEDGGSTHFDDEEKWTIDKNHGTNLRQIAAHEFGHALGLSHSSVRTSVMFPIYWGYEPTFNLHKDDIEGIQSLYGGVRKKGKNTFEPTPDYINVVPIDVTVVPDLCQDPSIDAATTTEDGRSYLFKGDYYWEVNDAGLVHRDARSISEDWGGLPGNLDAALTSEGDTYFFKKNLFWRTRNKQMQFGQPLMISLHWGVPNDLDAAFVWGGNGKIYFFKGSQYWRYDNASVPHIDDFYPLPIRDWEGVPDDIDAALPWLFDRSYFFKGDGYYRFDNKRGSVDTDDPPPFPRSTASWWFGCK